MGRGGSPFAYLFLMMMCWGTKGDVAATTYCCSASLGELGRTAMIGMMGPCRQGGGKRIFKISRSAKVLWGLDSSSGGTWNLLNLISTSNFGRAK